MGFLVGFFAPLGSTILAEISPISFRAKAIGILNVGICLGQVFGYLIAYFVLDSFAAGN